MTADPSWIEASWPARPGVIAGTTTRIGGVSTGSFESLNLATHVGDDADAVAVNRQRFVTQLDLPVMPRWLNQVHGTDVLVDPGEEAESNPDADAIVSRQAGVVCAVLSADCLPVLFVSEDGVEIAAAHAGWRGLSAGILEATVAKFEAAPEMIFAWLGPAISQPSFEVGDEVRTAFLEHSAAAAHCFQGNARGRWQADLYALARLRLVELGLSEISGGGHCTYQDDASFFSYRRDGQCGRMASFVFRYAESPSVP